MLFVEKIKIPTPVDTISATLKIALKKVNSFRPKWQPSWVGSVQKGK
jgi:hypothetical protein